MEEILSGIDITILLGIVIAEDPVKKVVVPPGLTWKNQSHWTFYFLINILVWANEVFWDDNDIVVQITIIFVDPGVGSDNVSSVYNDVLGAERCEFHFD